MREGIRAYYRSHYPLLKAHRENPHLNPGMGSVSPFTHEPKVRLAVLEGMLSPYLASGNLQLLRQHTLVSAEFTGDRVDAVALLAGSQRA